MYGALFDTASVGAGRRLAWVNRTGDPSERIGGEPNLSVESLSELGGALG